MKRTFTISKKDKLKLPHDETPLYILIIGMIAGIILALALRWMDKY
jgi:hypothetical protein